MTCWNGGKTVNLREKTTTLHFRILGKVNNLKIRTKQIYATYHEHLAGCVDGTCEKVLCKIILKFQCSDIFPDQDKEVL